MHTVLPEIKQLGIGCNERGHAYVTSRDACLAYMLYVKQANAVNYIAEVCHYVVCEAG